MWEFYPRHKNPKYLDRQAWAKSVDPDQTPRNAASDLGLHALPLIQQFLGALKVEKTDVFKF